MAYYQYLVSVTSPTSMSRSSRSSSVDRYSSGYSSSSSLDSRDITIHAKMNTRNDDQEDALDLCTLPSDDF